MRIPIKTTDKLLNKIFSWIGDNFDDKYRIVETSVPKDNEGKDGEIRLINYQGTKYICGKIDGSWVKTTLT